MRRTSASSRKPSEASWRSSARISGHCWKTAATTISGTSAAMPMAMARAGTPAAASARGAYAAAIAAAAVTTSMAICLPRSRTWNAAKVTP